MLSEDLLLEEAHKKGKIETVDPFITNTVFAEIPTKLPSGSYLARFEVKNDGDVKLSGEVNLSVLPYGTLQTAGFGFLGLSIAHKLSIIIPVLFFIFAPVLIFIRSKKRRR